MVTSRRHEWLWVKCGQGLHKVFPNIDRVLDHLIGSEAELNHRVWNLIPCAFKEPSRGKEKVHAQAAQAA